MRCLHVNTEQCAAAGAGTRYNCVTDEDSATPSLNGDTAVSTPSDLKVEFTLLMDEVRSQGDGNMRKIENE